MENQSASEWLPSLSTGQKIRALSLMYSWLTISGREFFRPPVPEGKERFALDKLCGINELHHTIPTS
jgi:hypothetical protein